MGWARTTNPKKKIRGDVWGSSEGGRESTSRSRGGRREGGLKNIKEGGGQDRRGRDSAFMGHAGEGGGKGQWRSSK